MSKFDSKVRELEVILNKPPVEAKIWLIFRYEPEMNTI